MLLEKLCKGYFILLWNRSYNKVYLLFKNTIPPIRPMKSPLYPVHMGTCDITEPEGSRHNSFRQSGCALRRQREPHGGGGQVLSCLHLYKGGGGGMQGYRPKDKGEGSHRYECYLGQSVDMSCHGLESLVVLYNILRDFTSKRLTHSFYLWTVVRIGGREGLGRGVMLLTSLVWSISGAASPQGVTKPRTRRPNGTRSSFHRCH